MLKKKFFVMVVALTLILSGLTSSVVGASSKQYGKSYNKFISNSIKNMNSKEEKKGFSENQLVIKYSSPISANEHRAAGGKLVKRFQSLGYDIVEVQGRNKIEDLAQNYAKLPKVSSISRSAFVTTFANDPKANDMFHLQNLQVEKAHSLAGKHKVKVGVIDSGIDAYHPELKNRLIVNKNIMDPLKKGVADSHGTHVAGIIAAEKNNGIGGFGIAPNSEIVSIDVFNRSFFVTDYIVAEGILEAIRQNVNVINMSLGSSFPSPILKDAVKQAIDKGITVVAAAGNDGVSMLNYPASYEGVISVGALDANNELAFFSTFGPSVDVVAPGHKVYAPVYDADKGSSFVEMSGTSMASPVVAGAVSLLLSKHPDLTPYEVKYILTKTAVDLGDQGYDLKYGHGMIDLEKMLSFDPKQIPANPNDTEGDVLSKSTKLGSLNDELKNGKLTHPNQTDYYQKEVDSHEYLQLTLKGTANHDLAMDIFFYKKGDKEPAMEMQVNDVGAGETEALLFQAPTAGTVVIAVKDQFGQYSESGKSTYELTIEKDIKLYEDSNTLENPEVIEELPYKSGNQYFTDETIGLEIDEEETERVLPGDSDYFTFKVPGDDEEQLVTMKVELSDVPGIDSSLILHALEYYEGELMQYEVDRASYNGIGKGEVLTLSAYPGQEFMIEVTNKPYFDYFLFAFGGFEIDFERNYSSLKPYELKVDYTIHPPDEDGIPFDYMYGAAEEALANGDMNNYVKLKQEFEKKMFDPYYLSFEDQLKQTLDAALPIYEDVTKRGALQVMGDEDWFAFMPKHSSIFEISMGNGNGYAPTGVEILAYNEETNGFKYIYSNVQWDYIGGAGAQESFTLGLQKDQTYYIRLSDPLYRAVFDRYSLTIKSKIKNVADAHESNDSYSQATKISTNPVTGNFATAGDVDIYYFKPEKDGLFSVRVTPGELPAQYKQAPSIHRSEIDPVIFIYEDTDGDGVLSLEERNSVIIVDYALYNAEERTGFRTKKGAGYFIETFDYFSENSSLVPYVLKIDEVNQQDEDHDSVVKNNIPSKPITLQKQGAGFKATGYLNATNNKGDVDYYELNLDKDRKLTLSLHVPNDIDGKVTIYTSAGRQVIQSDNYGRGDSEIVYLSLKKGKYYIKVEDAFGNASADPYQLVIE